MRIYLIRAYRWTILLGVLAAIAFGLWALYRSFKIEKYYRLLSQRFPESYAKKLAPLQFDYPSWHFLPVTVSDLKWRAILEKELTPSWNLVVSADWAVGKWNKLKEKNYTPYYAKDAKAYDSGAWYQASEEAIAYFMDPRNFLNAEDIFMFETLGYDAESQTLKAVEKTLASTFMAGKGYDGGEKTFASLVAEVGARHGISPVFLAGRLTSEQGIGSVQAFGTIGDALYAYSTNTTGKIGSAVIWGKKFTKDGKATAEILAKGPAEYNGYYNFFNFRAYGLGVFEIKYNAYLEAKKTDAKYLGPWTTQARAIEGGAIKIKERYLDTKRHTRYFQKFSVLPSAGPYRWKQYMQNIAAPLIESRNTFKSYKAARTIKLPYVFLIPVYSEMPNAPAPDPAKGRSVYSPTR